jgi:hypothetical protein
VVVLKPGEIIVRTRPEYDASDRTVNDTPSGTTTVDYSITMSLAGTGEGDEGASPTGLVREVIARARRKVKLAPGALREVPEIVSGDPEKILRALAAMNGSEVREEKDGSLRIEAHR